MAEQQKFTIRISSKYGPEERAAIGLDIIDQIIKRTKSGKDKKGEDFKGYSSSYKKSFDFKQAGKGSKVNLTLSGEMLNALTILESEEGRLTIGIPENDEFNNAKAEGNIKGTYGKSKPIRGKKRDFMGISRNELKEITSNYPINNQENRNATARRVFETLIATEASQDLASNLGIEGFNDEL